MANGTTHLPFNAGGFQRAYDEYVRENAAMDAFMRQHQQTLSALASQEHKCTQANQKLKNADDACHRYTLAPRNPASVSRHASLERARKKAQDAVTNEEALRLTLMANVTSEEHARAALQASREQALRDLRNHAITARITVVDAAQAGAAGAPIDDAKIHVASLLLNSPAGPADECRGKARNGTLTTTVRFGDIVYATAFGVRSNSVDCTAFDSLATGTIDIRLMVNLGCTVLSYVFKPDRPLDPTVAENLMQTPSVQLGTTVVLVARANAGVDTNEMQWKWRINGTDVGPNHPFCQVYPVDPTNVTVPTAMLIVDTRGLTTLTCEVRMEGPNTAAGAQLSMSILPAVPSRVDHSGKLFESRVRSDAGTPRNDLALWVVIRKATEELSYESFQDYMDYTMYGKALPVSGPDVAEIDRERRKEERLRYLPFMDSEAYRALKVSAEAFVKVNCSVMPPALPHLTTDFTNLVSRRMGSDVDAGAVTGFWNAYRKQVNGLTDPITPYLELIRQKLPEFLTIGGTDYPAAPLSAQRLREKLMFPCLIELIWSYWHEEGMLVQSMNAISRRFQNIPAPGNSDPLANLETDPLRPLNNLLWGYIQDEQHRLTVARRSYEYDHHYGITLYGKAVPKQRGADTRSRFLEAYHNLLFLCTQFFQQDDDTNFISDGFPVLNALKEIHLILTQGSHNQFGDLPATARTEMLMQQWLLARPEFREFLPTRVMVALPEPWMDRVDAMKSLQGWSDVSVLHFRNLAKYGEQLLLSIRYGAWSDIDDADVGKYWARFWRSEIQGYIHAYRAVTGVDLTREPVDCTPPSELLRQRMAAPRLAA